QPDRHAGHLSGLWPGIPAAQPPDGRTGAATAVKGIPAPVALRRLADGGGRTLAGGNRRRRPAQAVSHFPHPSSARRQDPPVGPGPTGRTTHPPLAGTGWPPPSGKAKALVHLPAASEQL